MLENKKQQLVESFFGILKSFSSRKEYRENPPKGPPEDLPTLSEKELKSLQQTAHGEELGLKTHSYSEITVNIEGDISPKDVYLPNPNDLKDINICGIDGSNQRIDRSSFYLILSRATIVNFRYSKQGYKPYFYTKSKDSSAVIWVDGNVFTEDIRLHTRTIEKGAQGNVDILPEIIKEDSLPLLVRYDPEKSNKSPVSQALGWGVKFMQALELACIKDVPKNTNTICIKDGPLFSTSVSPKDVISGLEPIFSWKNQILVACSKRVKDSTLLVEALLQKKTLRDYWFPKQKINDQTLKAIATDSLLLPRILKPGQRTPLMAAVPLARKAIVEQERRLMPLTCYYFSKHRPNTFIRLEIPKFMYDKNKDLVNKAIKIVAWQHELGHKAPLVQVFADQRCQLDSEKRILEKQTSAALYKNKLEFPEVY